MFTASFSSQILVFVFRQFPIGRSAITLQMNVRYVNETAYARCDYHPTFKYDPFTLNVHQEY